MQESLSCKSFLSKSIKFEEVKEIWVVRYNQWKSNQYGQERMNQLIVHQYLVPFGIAWKMLLNFGFHFWWTQISCKYCIIFSILGYIFHMLQMLLCRVNQDRYKAIQLTKIVKGEWLASWVNRDGLCLLRYRMKSRLVVLAGITHGDNHTFPK